MWYVIQVKTGEENGIARKLKNQAIRAEVPIENRPIRSGGAWTKKEYILFPGYVFLDMDFTARNYYRVKEVPGVIRFLGDSKAPSTLSYLEAEWIRILFRQWRATGTDYGKGRRKRWYHCHQRSFKAVRKQSFKVG